MHGELVSLLGQNLTLRISTLIRACHITNEVAILSHCGHLLQSKVGDSSFKIAGYDVDLALCIILSHSVRL